MCTGDFFFLQKKQIWNLTFWESVQRKYSMSRCSYMWHNMCFSSLWINQFRIYCTSWGNDNSLKCHIWVEKNNMLQHVFSLHVIHNGQKMKRNHPFFPQSIATIFFLKIQNLFTCVFWFAELPTAQTGDQTLRKNLFPAPSKKTKQPCNKKCEKQTLSLPSSSRKLMAVGSFDANIGSVFVGKWFVAPIK